MTTTSIYQIIHQLMRLQTLPYANSTAVRGRQLQFDKLHAALDKRGYTGSRPSRQLKRMSVEVINAALYETDPMNTCCKENGLTEEYKTIASMVFQHIHHGMVMEAAIDQALCAIFGDHLVNGEQIERVMHELVGMSEG
ncbi:hypothetical protein [Pseudidiomarina sp.]|uniref:hypothetical protein n=1 Tax=Pseudidiomarina sp. TaxID=2081707 RepID=UPI003A96EFDB